jgi:hypothetical protein
LVSKKIILKLILLIFAIYFYSSCASTGFLMAKAKVVMYGPTYPAKGLDEQIDVYKTNKPDHEYIEIAELSCADTDDNWSMKQILKKAREIGADAIIILGTAGEEAIGIPVGKTVYAASQEYGLKAIAIKYKK